MHIFVRKTISFHLYPQCALCGLDVCIKWQNIAHCGCVYIFHDAIRNVCMCVYYMSMFIVHNCARCTHIVNVVGKGIGMCGTMRNILCVKVREENKAQSLTRFLADSSLVYRSFYMFAIKMCVPMLRCTRNWSWLATLRILPVFLGCLVLSCLTFVSHVFHNCCIDVCVLLCAVLKGCLWMIM
jgi:hypothetical protein